MHELKQVRERLMSESRAEPGRQELADALGWVGDVLRAERAAAAEHGMDLLEDPVAEGAYEAVLDALAGVQVAPLLLRLTERGRPTVWKSCLGV